MADVLQKIASQLYAGEADDVAELVQSALDKGLSPTWTAGRSVLPRVCPIRSASTVLPPLPSGIYSVTS